MRIAIVGTGIAGLATAWLLHRHHEVTVFEAEPRPGGHSHTVDVRIGERSIPVDTGFIVYNEATYPNLTRLFATLGVPTEWSDMSFAASLDDGRLEYAGHSLRGLLGQPRNLLRPRFHRLLVDIPRFNRAARRFLEAGPDDERSMRTFLAQARLGRSFVWGYLVPMAAAIWSAPPASILEVPARSLLRFFANHQLLGITGHHRWRTVSGGSRRYVAAMTAPLRHRLRLATPVTAVRRTADGVELATASGERFRFDRVVLSCHADQALAIMADPDPDERAILGAFRFQPNRAILHRDPALMPRRRRCWASWNYLSTGGDPGAQRVSVTYWMNRLQNLDPDVPIFVSLNPIREPDPALVHGRFDYAHPILDAEALRAQRRLPRIRGRGGIDYAGAWMGWGFHEDGLEAAIAAAAALGVAPPWREGGPARAAAAREARVA
ncbi:MAG: FAD-dependent oxidoreductase [Geminicoccaceae bacterium]|nr:FAD-dependent oxidoreductase [Geminicoccaceae bacterium]